MVDKASEIAVQFEVARASPVKPRARCACHIQNVPLPASANSCSLVKQRVKWRSPVVTGNEHGILFLVAAAVNRFWHHWLYLRFLSSRLNAWSKDIWIRTES